MVIFLWILLGVVASVILAKIILDWKLRDMNK
jgi:hypothetical protein